MDDLDGLSEMAALDHQRIQDATHKAVTRSTSGDACWPNSAPLLSINFVDSARHRLTGVGVKDKAFFDPRTLRLADAWKLIFGSVATVL